MVHAYVCVCELDKKPKFANSKGQVILGYLLLGNSDTILLISHPGSACILCHCQTAI